MIKILGSMDKPKEMIGEAGVKEKTEKGVYLEHFLI